MAAVVAGPYADPQRGAQGVAAEQTGTPMARHDTHAAELRKVERFADLSEAEIKSVAAAGTHVHLPANWSLMSETTPADKAYIILSGRVSIRKKGAEVAEIGPGDILGEVGVLQHRLRTAAAVSLTELSVMHFTNEDLTRLVDEVPAFGSALQATARDHLSDD